MSFLKRIEIVISDLKMFPEIFFSNSKEEKGKKFHWTGNHFKTYFLSLFSSVRSSQCD